MANKIAKDPNKRAYTMKARARRQEQLHLRITKAAMQLHGSVGPAKTTVSDIAKLAGVRRATVYNHFPSDLDLFNACSSHWFGENPPPDPAGWERVVDPELRAEIALEAMYDYYDRGRDMLGNVFRDISLVPAAREVVETKWQPILEVIVELLTEGWLSVQGAGQGERSGMVTEPELRATLRVALDFWTWQILTASGLSNEEAARLAARWIRLA